MHTLRMDKGKLQELLVTLYLRLNGYFTSGLILHAPTGNQTEVDVLAVRFPHHFQPEREVASANELECSDEEVDIVIGEVKSRGEKLQFNAALRHSPEALSKVLRWVGVYAEDEIGNLAEKVCREFQPNEIAKCRAPAVSGPRGTRIRGLIFSPERTGRRVNQPWFLDGPPVLEYLWLCLHPETPRPESATKYNFGLWGSELEVLVRHIKSSQKPGTFEKFLEDFEKLANSEQKSNGTSLSPFAQGK